MKESLYCRMPECFRPAFRGDLCDTHVKRQQRGGALNAPVAETASPSERVIIAAHEMCEARTPTHGLKPSSAQIVTATHEMCDVGSEAEDDALWETRWLRLIQMWGAWMLRRGWRPGQHAPMREEGRR